LQKRISLSADLGDFEFHSHSRQRSGAMPGATP
jgi:hypothetical protein